MAVTQDEVEALLAEPEQAPEPAGPAGGGVTEAEVASMFEEDERTKDAQVQAIFDAGLTRNPDRHAAILEIARKTRAPARLVEANYDAFARAAKAADFDGARFRQENAILADIILEQPELGPVVFADKPLSSLERLKLTIFDAFDDLQKFQRDFQREHGITPATPSGPSALPDARPGHDHTQAELDVAAIRDTVGKPIPMVADPAALSTQTVGGMFSDTLAYWRGEKDRVEPPAIFQKFASAYGSTSAGVDASKVGMSIINAKVRGEDTWELEKQLVDLEQKTQARYLAPDAMDQFAVDFGQLAPSQIETAKAGGVGGVVVGGAGAVPGLLARNPQLAAEGFGWGFRVGGKAGAALASFSLETGSAYIEIRKERLDDGTPIDDNVAIGASVIYGALAAAIEMDALGTELSAMGPLGQAIKQGSAKAFFTSAMKDATKRQLIKEAGKAWLTASTAEAKQEVFEQIIQDGMTWLGKSVSAGKAELAREIDAGEVSPLKVIQAAPQQVDLDAAADRALETFVTTARGTLVMGGATGGVNLMGNLVARDASLHNGQRVAAIVGLKDSATVRAAPEAVARLIEEKSAAGGDPIAHMYVDPQAFVRYFQEGNADAVQAAAELLGEQGPAKLKEALATGQKLEVPMTEYLERWGSKPVAEALARDTAVRPGDQTLNELGDPDLQKQVEKDAAELVKAWEKNGAPVAGEEEGGKAEKIRAQLVAAGYTAKEADRQAAIWRAFFRTKAQAVGVDPEVLFKDVDINVLREGQPAPVLSSEATSTVAAQGPTEAPGASAALSDRVLGPVDGKPLTNEERARDLYVDPVSGLRNRRAWDASPRQDGKQVAVITTPDIKAINDDPNGGHDTANGLLRVIGHAVGAIDPEAARSGTNFLLHVADKDELDRVLSQLRAALPDQALTLEGALGGDVDAAFKALDASVDAKRNAGELAPRGATRFDLAQLPGLKLAENRAQENLSPDLVSQAGAMAPEQFFREAYQDKDIPGVLSATGWHNIARKAWVASLDLKGLKSVNEVFKDKAVGDRILAAFTNAAQGVDGSDFDFAHLSGDEYAAQHDSKEALEAWLAELRAELQNVGVPATLPSGERVELHADFRHGVGEKTYGAADRALNAAKRREQAAKADELRRAGGVAPEAPRVEGEDSSRGNQLEGEAGVDARRKHQRRGAPAQGFRDRRPGKDGRLNQLQSIGSGLESARGYVEMSRDGTRRLFNIVIRENADLSTFLHESGHVFLELMGDLAAREDAPERIRNDWAATLKYLGVEKREDIQREHHERWARSFEAYLLEGKAPSARLEGAFTRFKAWLTQVYRSIASLNVPINDDIRGVFDRLLATDAELERSQSAMGLRPLWRSPEEAGMSPDEWKAYLDDQEKATSGAARRLEAQVLKDRARELESWWKEEHTKKLEEARTDYEKLPASRAWGFIKKGVLAWESDAGVTRTTSREAAQRLDRDAVEQIVGPDVAKRLSAWTKKDGIHPDEVAELFGFPTGRDMMTALDGHPARESWAKEHADAAMRDQYPELLQEKAKLAEASAKALHSEHTSRWLLKEWAALGAKAGGRVPHTAAIRLAAQQMVDRQSVRSLNAYRSLQAERSAADKAAKAAAKGDFAQAYVFKQQQLLNHFLYQHLAEAREMRDKFEELTGKLSKDKYRARLGKASPAYRDVVDQVLEALGLRARTNDPTPRASVNELISVMEANANTVAFDADALQGLLASPRDWKDLTVGQLRNTFAALSNIKKSATNANTVMLEGKRIEKAAVVVELVLEAEMNLKHVHQIASSESAETTWQKLGGLWNAFDGQLLKPETMIRGMLGGGRLDSMWFRAIMKPLQDAKSREVDLLRTTIQPILKAFETIPESVRERSMELVDGRQLFPDHRDRPPAPSRRYELLMLVLNAGNESNLQRLLEGRRITYQQVVAAANLLTKEEMDWIQSVWDAAESLWPEARALEERDAGIAPPKIEPKPLITKHGTYRGGYFPAVYDRRVEPLGEKQAAGQVAALMDPSYTRPGTSHSHLKSRAQDFSGVISLEPSSIPSHLAQVAHDIAYREAVKSVGSLILNHDVQTVLKERLGDGRAKQFLQWVKDVGQMRGAEGMQHAGVLLKAARMVKANTVLSVLGYSLPNAVEDITNLPAAVFRTELKTKHLAAALAQMAAAPIQTFEEATAKSGELRTRHEQVQRELAKQVQSLTKKGLLSRGPLAFVKDHAFVFMEFSDKLTSTAVWLGAYRQATSDGQGEADAVTFADSIVRQVFPSHSPVDAAAILRDKGYIGTVLTFYGFLNTAYNSIREMVHPLTQGQGSIVAVGGRLTAYMVTLSVLSELIRGRAPDDGEDWEEWFLRKLLTGTISTVPFGGDAGAFIESKVRGRQYNPRSTSLVGVGASVGDAAMKLYDELGEDSGKLDERLEGFLKSLGPFVGVPPAKPVGTAFFLKNVMDGDAPVDNPSDVVAGVYKGGAR